MQYKEIQKVNYYTPTNIDDRAKFFADQLKLQREKHKNQVILSKQIALLVIDMQGFFYDQDYHAFVPSISSIVPRIKLLQEYFFKHDMPVFHTQHENTLQDSKQMLGWWGSINEGTNSHANIIAEITDSRARIIKKNQYDAFWGTKLEELLQSKDIKQLIITGVVTHLCCETTARSAFVRGFEVFFPIDGTATYNPEFHFSTLYNVAHGFALPVLIEEIFNGFNSNKGACL